jgi:polyhydroxyalkanoate synthesis regulator phasin
MANKLKKLIVNRVDLVDRPSNPAARVMLFKRELSKGMFGAKTTDDVITSDAWWTAYYKLMDAFAQSVSSIIWDADLADGKKASMLKASVAEVADHLTALFDAYPVAKSENAEIYVKIEKTVDVLNELDTLVDGGTFSADDVETILGGIEMAKDAKTADETAVETLKAEIAAKDAEIAKSAKDVETLKAEIETLKTQVVEKKTAETDATDIWKGVNPGPQGSI